MSSSTFPLVVAFIILKGNKILLQKRKNTNFYDDHWGLPAGKIEASESPIQTLKREAFEELGINIIDFELTTVLASKAPLLPNNKKRFLSDNQKFWHDVIFFFKINTYQGEIYNKEPKKHQQLEWFEISNLPSPLVPVAKEGINQFIRSKNYGEIGY